MRAILAIALAACGPSVAVVAPLPPNTSQACTRAVSCGVFLDSQHGACVACLEHADPKVVDAIGPLPPLDMVSCDDMARVASGTNLSECVSGLWYGPFDFTWGTR